MSPLLGLLGIVGSVYYVFQYSSPTYSGYFDVPSAVLLGLAPPCVMLLSHSLMDFLTGVKLLLSAMSRRLHSHHEEVIVTLTEASKAVRSEGLGALMKFRERCRYDLLRDGISLIINDFKPEEIRNNLTARINAKQTQMQLAQNLFDNMAKVCPGIGMIGTLLGLIGMLANMNDPSKIGGSMALAMITTLYGLLLGTFVYAPAAEKIGLQAERTLEIDLLVVEGVLNIKGKKSSIHLKDLVKSYSAANKAAKDAGAAGGAGGGGGGGAPGQGKKGA